MSVIPTQSYSTLYTFVLKYIQTRHTHLPVVKVLPYSVAFSFLWLQDVFRNFQTDTKLLISRKKTVAVEETGRLTMLRLSKLLLQVDAFWLSFKLMSYSFAYAKIAAAINPYFFKSC